MQPQQNDRRGKEAIQAVLQRVRSVPVTPGDQGFPVPDRVTISGTGHCKTCLGFGWLRSDHPVGDRNFGRMNPCPDCRADLIAESERSAVYKLSSLPDLGHLSFDNFLVSRPGYTPAQVASLTRGLNVCRDYASSGRGWLVVAGPYGCGKTHLAAAIANATVLPALFVTMPDLLDQLRDGYNDKGFDYWDRFEQVRDIPLLVLDDFAAENSTPWGSEKIFQLVNSRYIRSLPTVFTTNAAPDQIDGRIASRMSDQRLSRKVVIEAPDFRKVK